MPDNQVARREAAAPRSLRLLQHVRSESPFPPFRMAWARTYGPDEIEVNQHGAVSLRIDGVLLGVKPDEMEWI